MEPHEFFDALRNWCAFFDGSITSYGRTSKHNSEVGGVSFSAHLFWLAADVVYDDPPPSINVATETAKRLKLMLVREPDHDHLQPADWPPG
jgi:Peptidase M15